MVIPCILVVDSQSIAIPSVLVTLVSIRKFWIDIDNELSISIPLAVVLVDLMRDPSAPSGKWVEQPFKLIALSALSIKRALLILYIPAGKYTVPPS